MLDLMLQPLAYSPYILCFYKDPMDLFKELTYEFDAEDVLVVGQGDDWVKVEIKDRFFLPEDII